MSESRVSRSLRRSKWLSDLARALEDAHRLALQMGDWDGGSAEAVALKTTLQAAMAEVDALRRGHPADSRKIEPKRTGRPSLPVRRPPSRDPTA